MEGATMPRSPVRLPTGKVSSDPMPFGYEKVIELFTASHSSMLAERHVAAVHRLCRANADGFPIRDLDMVDQVLSLLLQNMSEEGKAEVYGEATCALLRSLGLPFIKRTATDEFKMLSNISQILGTISNALGGGNPVAVQIAAAETLAEFASAHGSRPSVFDYESTEDASSRQFHANQALVEKSGVVPAAVAALQEAVAMGGDDPSLRESIAFTVLQFSYKVENCYQMVEAGVLDTLASLLDVGNMRDPVVVTACETMWNVLESVPDSRPLVDGGVDSAALRTKMSAVLTKLTEGFLTAGHRLADKEIRNELLVVADLLVGEEANRAAFGEGGLLPLALAVATCPELHESSSLVKPFALTREAEDFEMKRLMLEVCSFLCTEGACLEAALAAGLLEVAAAYLDPATKCAGVLRWTDAQRRDLREQVLSILYRVVPLCAEEFASRGHLVTLLGFVRACTDEGLLRSALRVLRRVTPLPGYAAMLGEAGAVAAALELFSEQGGAEVVREDAAALLSALCSSAGGGGGGDDAAAEDEAAAAEDAAEGAPPPPQDEEGSHSNLREFRRLGGVAALVDELESLRALDPTLLSPLALAVVDAVWNCVVASRRNLARFLAQDGMVALLDLLEVCNRHLHSVVLSCLADILESPRSHVFFHEWRSRRDGSLAAQMVVGIWREQEVKRGVVEEGAGVLANTSRPLAGTGQRTRWSADPQAAFTFQDPVKRGSQAAVAEAVGVDEMMAKVYSVVAGLGVESLGYLGHEDAAAVAAIEQYVRFRQGEVWQDISAELEGEGMKPTEPDRLRLESGIQRCEAVAGEVVEAQASILHQAYDEATGQEAVFYENMQAQRAQEGEARKYKRNRAQLTMKERLEAKLKKEQMLSSSFKPKLKPGFLKDRTEWLVEGEAAEFV